MNSTRVECFCGQPIEITAEEGSRFSCPSCGTELMSPKQTTIQTKTNSATINYGGIIAIIAIVIGLFFVSYAGGGLALGILILLAAGLCLYFLPTTVALKNKKKNATAILILNLFLGWTFLGWVIALVWASCKD